MVFNWLKNLLADTPEKAIEKAALNSEIFLIGTEIFQKVLNDKSKGLGQYAKEEFKTNLAAEASKLMGSVLTSTNPLLTNRGNICAGLLQQANYMVLITKDKILGKDNLALKGLPVISGELYDHILEIAEKDDEIKDLKWSLEEVNHDTLYYSCLHRYYIYDLKVRMFNAIRASKEINDSMPPDKEKDWFAPLQEFQLAYHEAEYRKKIGLKNILDTDKNRETLKIAQCFILQKFVLGGEKYPYLKWEEGYKKDFAED